MCVNKMFPPPSPHPPPPPPPPPPPSSSLPRHLCGSLGTYDVAKEKKISLRTPHKLEAYDRIFHKVTTTDDPIIRKV